jgi:hypothetical protein
VNLEFQEQDKESRKRESRKSQCYCCYTRWAWRMGAKSGRLEAYAMSSVILYLVLLEDIVCCRIWSCGGFTYLPRISSTLYILYICGGGNFVMLVNRILSIHGI